MQRLSFLFVFLAISSLTVLSGQGGCHEPGTYQTTIVPPNPEKSGGSSKYTIVLTDTTTGKVTECQVEKLEDLPKHCPPPEK